MFLWLSLSSRDLSLKWRAWPNTCNLSSYLLSTALKQQKTQTKSGQIGIKPSETRHLRPVTTRSTEIGIGLKACWNKCTGNGCNALFTGCRVTIASFIDAPIICHQIWSLMGEVCVYGSLMGWNGSNLAIIETLNLPEHRAFEWREAKAQTNKQMNLYLSFYSFEFHRFSLCCMMKCSTLKLYW